MRDHLYISGTTAGRAESGARSDSAYEQTRSILLRIEAVLVEAGFAFSDVVRTRMFVTDIDQWEEYGRAHGEFFAEIKPGTTMVAVSRLIEADMLIEIEVDAVRNS